MSNSAPQESFYDRIKRQKDELMKQIDGSDSRAALKALMALDEQERNPPWQELLCAILERDFAKVDELTSDGTLIKLMNGERVTALMQAAYTGQEKILDLLLARDADPDIAGHDGLTALSCAAIKNEVKIFEKLLKAGADPHVRTAQGDTIRQLATYSKSKDVLKILNREHRLKKNKSVRPAAKQRHPGR